MKLLRKLKLWPEFKQEPTIWTLAGLVKCTREVSTEINGKWVPMRPQCAIGIVSRFRAAWRVFTGKADALMWPEGQ
jgi:hypothetical protein